MSDELTCPHDGCIEPLILQWYGAYMLAPADLDGPHTLLMAEDAHTSTWQVECAAGHVILLPGPLGCPCESDPQLCNDCPHDVSRYDWSEDNRSFRTHDGVRLKAVIDRIGDTS